MAPHVTDEPADPIAKGILSSAKQAFGDLFRWRMRVEVINDLGETTTVWRDPPKWINPFSLFAQLTAMNWVYFLVGFFAWVADAFDFHALSIQTYKLALYFNRTKTDITTAITLTLLLRSVGAAVFGLLGDRFGRKWPMVVNMFILGFLQIATIYCQNFEQFLAVRSLFGLFMGGVYGNAVAMALENSPVEARGLMSGILQQGYSFGYVLAASSNLINSATDGWQIVFWIAAGLSFAAGFLRCLFPESKQFLEAKKSGHHVTPAAFMKETRSMLRQDWKLCVYCVILMTWFNFYSHTSQDSYTTFMVTQKELNSDAGSRASIWMKVGACVGGTIIGYLSQFVGRRRAIIVAALISCFLIPAWILPEGEHSLSASGFMMQFFVQGAWGVIPIHLNELSPPAYRSSFPGISYQLGNMISSPSAQIVNVISESHWVRAGSGRLREAYGPTMGIATAIIGLGIAFTAAIGPEKRGRHFENAAIAGANVDRPSDTEKAVDAVSMEENARTRSGVQEKEVAR